MNKVLSYIILIISLQNVSLHKILPMEIEKTTDGTTTEEIEITIEEWSQKSWCTIL